MKLSLAEREGFEPSVPLRVHMISKPNEDMAISRDIEKTRPNVDPRGPEKPPIAPPVGQSRGNADRLSELDLAIANLTRLLGATDDPTVAAELIGERRAMRAELDAMRPEATRNVIAIEARRRR